VLRGHALRRDGTIDTVMCSMRAGEWPEAKAQLIFTCWTNPRPSSHP
jgi:hypothetical protein